MLENFRDFLDILCHSEQAPLRHPLTQFFGSHILSIFFSDHISYLSFFSDHILSILSLCPTFFLICTSSQTDAVKPVTINSARHMYIV